MNPPNRALIIGGGVAGPVLALFLKSAGIQSAIYEAAPSPVFDGAGLGLAPNGLNVLSAAGVLDQILAGSVEVSHWVF